MASLLTYAKFKTGLKLLSIRSRLAFFSSGLTKTSLSVSRNTPSSRERFTISVMSSRMHGSICFRRSVGIGSSSQLLFGVASIISLPPVEIDCRTWIVLLCWELLQPLHGWVDGNISLEVGI